MIQNFILMDGYGIFVWSSFMITLFTCVIVYHKTLKTLRKYEREFAKEIQKLSKSRKNIVLGNSKIASEILSSYNKSI